MKKLTTRMMAVMTAVVALLQVLSCGLSQRPTTTDTATSADSLIFDAGAQKDYKRMVALADSFEAAGVISPVVASRWRGAAYYHQNQYINAERQFEKVMDSEIVTPQDQLSYIKSARRLSELLLVKGDFEGSLQVAMPAVEKMHQLNIGSDIDYAVLLNNIGCCQLNLGRDEEANESFLTARQHYINRWTTDNTSRGFQEAVIGTVYTSLAYINTRRYAESIYWIDRTEMLLNKYREWPDARFEYFDEYQGRIEIMRAVAKLGLGIPDTAAMAYQAFLKTEYSSTPAGRINANDYLMAAKRYAEAADNYRFLDQLMVQRDMEYSLDHIQLYLLPKLRANVGAHRVDSVMNMSLMVCNAVDSAINKSKSETTAELAALYNTQQQKAKIAEQDMALSRQRWVSTLIAMALLIIFFSIFIYARHRSAQRLAHAHAKLQKAYDKLEETTAVKERIESELRIARDIQMSMVPNIFPNHEGLDVYAAMIPAKEVGGDLYGYLLLGDQLFFCVGDVSGKGVPASLFMAQATRLFRTLAAQKMMPAEIATHMNAELAEDNEQGMFVTMFIGLVNVNTGVLDFCNCGHNPPVLIGKKGETGNGSTTERQAEFIKVEANAPIGLWPGLNYVGERIENIMGMPLLVYTDGLNEAENKEQEQFGEDRMLDILRHGNFSSAKQVVERLKSDVEQHRNGADPSDDLTLLCLKVG